MCDDDRESQDVGKLFRNKVTNDVSTTDNARSPNVASTQQHMPEI